MSLLYNAMAVFALLYFEEAVKLHVLLVSGLWNKLALFWKPPPALKLTVVSSTTLKQRTVNVYTDSFNKCNEVRYIFIHIYGLMINNTIHYKSASESFTVNDTVFSVSNKVL